MVAVVFHLFISYTTRMCIHTQEEALSKAALGLQFALLELSLSAAFILRLVA